MKRFEQIDWGLIPYAEAFAKQEQIFNLCLQQKLQGLETHDKLIFCEHPHVITLGKNGLYNNLLYSEDFLKDKNVSVFRSNRGGDLTYHGPGQMVVYPIFNLEKYNLGLKSYINLLEELVISLLKLYDIKGQRLPGATGVWLEVENSSKTRKICAMGVKCSRYITMHGLALNVNTDLDYFKLINPCGFTDKGVSSIENELKKKMNMDVLKSQAHELFQSLF